MLDPVLLHLQQAKQTAVWVAQLIRLEPELMLPAALPLVAARLMDAGGMDEEVEEPEAGTPNLGLAAGGQTGRRADGQTDRDRQKGRPG
jgi:hypothetical protein